MYAASGLLAVEYREIWLNKMIILCYEVVKWYFETYFEPKGKSGPSDHFIVFKSKSSVAKEQALLLLLHPVVSAFPL